MPTNLVSFGCSWTHGHGLSDPSNTSYPALVAKHYGLTLENLGEPGSTLVAMGWTLNEWLNNHSYEYIRDSIILVGLTFHSRQTWFNAHHNKPTIDYVNDKFIDSTLQSVCDENWKQVHKLHYTLSDCDEYNRLVYETTARQFDSVATKYGSTVFQFNVTEQQEPPIPHMTSPANLGYAMRSIDNKHLFQEDFHPNEIGHRYIAGTIINEIG